MSSRVDAADIMLPAQDPNDRQEDVAVRDAASAADRGAGARRCRHRRSRAASFPATTEITSPTVSTKLPPLFDDLEERTFRYFWDTADPATGLVPDRYPTPSFASIAAVGFALTAYPIGVERGWVTREAGARARPHDAALLPFRAAGRRAGAKRRATRASSTTSST